VYHFYYPGKNEIKLNYLTFKGGEKWLIVWRWKKAIFIGAKHVDLSFKSLDHVPALLEKRFHVLFHCNVAIRK
jgi:hypothetical protein